jgi:molecular chaperone DnaK
VVTLKIFLTLSIETLGSVATPLIERNTTIPARKSQIFSTAAANQSQVEIHVLQGERPMASDNKTLGRFILDGIPPAPRGVPQVEVTFDINANGILEVTASDKATGRSQNITITASSGLSDAEVEGMRKDAEKHAEEDLARKEKVEARNKADNMAYSAEKTLTDLGEKIPEDVKEKVQAKIDEVNTVLENEDADIDILTRVTDELGEEIQKIGETMYQQPGQEDGMPDFTDTGEPQDPPPGDSSGSDDEEIVDGEFRNA